MAKLQRKRSAVKQVPAGGRSSRDLPFQIFEFYLLAMSCLGNRSTAVRSKMAEPPGTFWETERQKRLADTYESKLLSWYITLVSRTRQHREGHCIIWGGGNWWSKMITDHWLRMIPPTRLTVFYMDTELVSILRHLLKQKCNKLAKTNAIKRFPSQSSSLICKWSRKELMVSEL